jgi:hypothetical protein
MSSTEDDFYEDDTLLFYLNKSQYRIVSFLASLEQRANKSLRALDGVRKVITATAPAPVLLFDGVWETQFNLDPSILQLLSIRHTKYKAVREIALNKIHLVFEGNSKPSGDEFFYFIITSGTTKIVKLYENNTHSGVNLELFSIVRPTALTTTATSLSSLPEQLENAVIYGAAEMMILQESIKDPNNSLQVVRGIYQDELNGGTF